MDWKEIKEENPNAFNVLEAWGNCPAVLSRQKKRLLYDFFDENEIYIGTKISVDGREIKGYVSTIRVMDNKYVDYWESSTLDCDFTRCEAEQKAFTKAFEILESKF